MILDGFWGFSRSKITFVTNDKPEKKYSNAVRFIVDHVIFKYHDKNADKMSKNMQRIFL